MTETETTTDGALDARLERQEQIKRFRKLREGIEAGILASKRALKGDDLDIAVEKLKDPLTKIEELKEILDGQNLIQVRSVARVADDLQRQSRRVETAQQKKTKGKSSRSRSRSRKGIPHTDLDHVLNALYLINRDHQDLFSELHIRKCANWAKRFKQQGYVDEKPLLTINNYIKKYKQRYLYEKDQVLEALNRSKESDAKDEAADDETKT